MQSRKKRPIRKGEMVGWHRALLKLHHELQGRGKGTHHQEKLLSVIWKGEIRTTKGYKRGHS